MNSNKLASIETDLFSPLSNLKELSLQNNQPEKLDVGSFKNLAQLEEVKLVENLFDQFDPEVLLDCKRSCCVLMINEEKL